MSLLKIVLLWINLVNGATLAMFLPFLIFQLLQDPLSWDKDMKMTGLDQHPLLPWYKSSTRIRIVY